jgi:hypothetical protein
MRSRAVKPVLTVILLAVAACGAPTTEDGVPLAPEVTPAVVGTPFTRVWNVSAAIDRGTGAELWRAEEVVYASGGFPAVSRIDPADGEVIFDENLTLQVESTLAVLDPATGAERAHVPVPSGAGWSVVDGLLVVTSGGPVARATAIAYRLRVPPRRRGVPGMGDRRRPGRRGTGGHAVR